MPTFLGLDCGGSSTRAMAVDESGAVLFRGQSGPANLVSTTPETIAANLRAALDKCPTPDAVCGCFAGMIGQVQRELGLSILADVVPGEPFLRVEPDYAAAFVACGPGTAACVVAGTGSIVCSRTEDGWATTGGYGALLGDRGSASEIGKSALRALLNDSATTSEELCKEVTEHFGSLDKAEVIARLYAGPSPAAILARLSPTVGSDAMSGRAYAYRIVNEEMMALTLLLKMHLGTFPTSDKRVGLAGGLWKSARIYRETFELAFEAAGMGKSEPFVLKLPPVEGAVELAKEMTIGN